MYVEGDEKKAVNDYLFEHCKPLQGEVICKCCPDGISKCLLGDAYFRCVLSELYRNAHFSRQERELGNTNHKSP